MLSVIMLSVIMLSVVMLSVVMLGVVMLSSIRDSILRVRYYVCPPVFCLGGSEQTCKLQYGTTYNRKKLLYCIIKLFTVIIDAVT
jgi:hypothetical protein